MADMNRPLGPTIAELPEAFPESLREFIRFRLEASDLALVVLDDDPTGTQTVYDVPVLTEWSVATLREQLEMDGSLFFILTNSRSLPEADAVALAQEVGENLLAASQQSGRPVELISRSDSTLRGHFPAEVDALAAALGIEEAVQVIAPFFLEGGRLTIDDIHYVVEDNILVPAAETPFAKDAAFGFSQSNLKEWVAEKTKGKIEAEQVCAISLNELRQGGPKVVAAKLTELPPGSVCIVNAVTLCDLEVFSRATMFAKKEGQSFLFRTAASFVQVHAGLSARPLLEAENIVDVNETAGLIVAGSYVPKTSAQLDCLLKQHSGNLTHVEISVPQLLDDTSRVEVIQQAVNQIQKSLKAECDVLLSTSRELVKSSTNVDNLNIGKCVSSALVEIVRSITVGMRFLITKGGITSSDLATRALNVRRATVLGQILPGVPVWRLGAESRRPGMGYVIFPGNVGDDEALAAAYDKLRHKR